VGEKTILLSPKRMKLGLLSEILNFDSQSRQADLFLINDIISSKVSFISLFKI